MLGVCSHNAPQTKKSRSDRLCAWSAAKQPAVPVHLDRQEALSEPTPAELFDRQISHLATLPASQKEQQFPGWHSRIVIRVLPTRWLNDRDLKAPRKGV